MPFRTMTGELLFPIGYVLFTTVDENPSSQFGGTWERFAQGRTIVGVDETQIEFARTTHTGGSKYLQAHSHSASSASSGAHTHTGYTSTNGNHNHRSYYRYYNDGGTKTEMGFADDYAGTVNNVILAAGDHSHSVTTYSSGAHSHTITVSSYGSGDSQNLQPYITTYIWVRTA